MRSTARICISLLFIVFSINWSSRAASDDTSLHMKESVQVFKNDSYNDWKIYPRSVVTSPDGEQVAYVVHKDNKTRVIMNDHAGPAYAGILAGTPVFSYDSKHLAYSAKKTNNSWVMVLDGKEGRAYDVISSPIFSTDSRHSAYIVKNQNRFCIVLDGKEGPYFAGISKTSIPSFSPDNKHFIYVALDENNRMHLVVDQKIISSAELIAFPSYSPDARQLVYVQKIKDKYFLVINNKPSQGPGYESINYLAYSPDSKYVIYLATKNAKSYLVKDGVEYGPYDNVGVPVIISPDSKRVVYVAKKKNEYLLIENGVVIQKSLSPFQNIMLSRNSKRFVYSYKMKDKHIIVVDNKRSKEYDGITPPAMSLDSKHVVYKARKGNKHMFVFDGIEGPLFDEIGEAILSNDSRHYAYAAKDNNLWKVVVDGKSGPAFPFVIHPMFSPDSSHIAYMALDSDVKGKYVFVVDHKKGKETFDGFLEMTPIVFDSPSSFKTIAITRGPCFALVKMEIR